MACLQREVSARESHGGEGRIRAARFPSRKSLEEFDFDHARGLKRDIIAHLGTLDFVTAKRQRRVPRAARGWLTLRFLLSGCVEQSRLVGFDLDTQAFAASAVDVDGLQFAALDLVQHGLSGDAKGFGGFVEAEPAVGDLGSDPVAEGLVDADAPGCARGDLFAVMKPSRIQRYRVILATPRIFSAAVMVTTTTSSPAGLTSGCRRLIDGDVVAGAQDRHPGSGEGQAGGGAAFLFGQDRRDGPVVVVLRPGGAPGRRCPRR